MSPAELTAWKYALGIEKPAEEKTECVVILKFVDFSGKESTLITDMNLNLDDSVEDQIYEMYPNVKDFKWVEKNKFE